MAHFRAQPLVPLLLVIAAASPGCALIDGFDGDLGPECLPGSEECRVLDCFDPLSLAPGGPIASVDTCLQQELFPSVCAPTPGGADFVASFLADPGLDYLVCVNGSASGTFSVDVVCGAVGGPAGECLGSGQCITMSTVEPVEFFIMWDGGSGDACGDVIVDVTPSVRPEPQ